MPSYGNTRIGGRSIFSTRKVRKNAGVKRGPRSLGLNSLFASPNNVVVVAPGPKKTRGRTHGPMFIGPLRPQNTRRSRKTRSNAGVPRKVQIANALGLAGMKIVGQRKTRKNKGVPRTFGLRKLFG